MGGRLRATIAALELSEGGEPIQLTVSAGGAMYRQGELSSPDSFIAQADLALYAAKASGRDRLVVDGLARTAA